MTVKLIGVPGSHPSLTVELILRHKRIEYRRVDLVNQLQKLVLPLAGYRSRTVPVVRLDGRRIAGSMAITRALDELRPEPPLFPREPDRHTRVEAAELWGHDVLQEAARRQTRWAARHDPTAVATFAEGARLPLPPALVRRSVPILGPVIVRTFGIPDEEVRGLLAELPDHLDRIDGWIGDGVIGGELPNAADFQIATSVRLLLNSDDLRPHIESRPVGRLARRLAPDYPGRFRPVFPAAWLEPLRATVG